MGIGWIRFGVWVKDWVLGLGSAGRPGWDWVWGLGGLGFGFGFGSGIGFWDWVPPPVWVGIGIGFRVWVLRYFPVLN